MIDLSKVVWTAIGAVVTGTLSLLNAVSSGDSTVSVCLALNSIALSMLSLRDN
jgi:hypothetical protein